MSSSGNDNLKTYLAIAAFVGQAVGSIYYFGQQNERLANSVDTIKFQLAEVKSNQVILSKLVTDMAVIQERHAVLAAEVANLRANGRSGRNDR